MAKEEESAQKEILALAQGRAYWTKADDVPWAAVSLLASRMRQPDEQLGHREWQVVLSMVQAGETLKKETKPLPEIWLVAEGVIRIYSQIRQLQLVWEEAVGEGANGVALSGQECVDLLGLTPEIAGQGMEGMLRSAKKKLGPRLEEEGLRLLTDKKMSLVAVVEKGLLGEEGAEVTLPVVGQNRQVRARWHPTQGVVVSVCERQKTR